MTGSDMEQLHPAISHFPVALLLMSVLFDALGYALGRPALHAVGFWNLVAGVGGGIAALYSGYLSERDLLGMDVPEKLIASHSNVALAAIVLFGALLALRLLWTRRHGAHDFPRAPLYLLVAVIAGGLLAASGRSGNRLVFGAAAGVMRPERPRVAVLPQAGASSQTVWAFGPSAKPVYGRPPMSAGSARIRAGIYLRTITPGKPLLRIRNGCKELHVPLMHANVPVAGVRVNPETGRLLGRSENPCAKQLRLPPAEVDAHIHRYLHEAQVGPNTWQGGHGAYWNVPFFKSGRMIDILRISARDGSLVPLAAEPAGDE